MLQQYVLFLYFLLLGVCLGVIYSLLNLIVFLCKKNIVVQIISDLLFSAIIGISFLYLANKFNSGEIRWFFVAGVIFGIFSYAKTLGKLFAKGGLLLYNHLVKLSLKFKQTKVGKVLFK